MKTIKNKKTNEEKEDGNPGSVPEVVSSKWVRLFLYFVSGLAFLSGGAIFAARPAGGAVTVVDTKQKSLLNDFFDTKVVFHSKSTWELYYSLLIFKMCSLPYFTELASEIDPIAEKLHLKKLLHWFLSKTFFQHFCAGKDEEEVKKYIEKFRKEGVNIILDHCVEDANEPSGWETNTNDLIKLLNQAKELEISFIPVKISSLTSPMLLEHISDLICHQQIDPSIQLNWNPNPVSKASRLPFSLPNSPSSSSPVPLSPEELNEMSLVMKRLNRICEVASKLNVGILIDAEQSFRQNGIDFFALQLSRLYNKNNRVVVYNTYQQYLNRTKKVLQEHLDLSEKEDFVLGVKIVRGAYFYGEDKRAQNYNYDSPVLPSKLDTDDNYDIMVKQLLERLAQNGKLSILIATHNLASVIMACQRTRELRIPSNHPRLHFAQLKGMADEITYGLSYSHFNTSKLLPFGPIDNVLKYLTRRLQENKDIMGGTQIERQMMWAEFKRRFGFSS